MQIKLIMANINACIIGFPVRNVQNTAIEKKIKWDATNAPVQRRKSHGGNGCPMSRKPYSNPVTSNGASIRAIPDTQFVIYKLVLVIGSDETNPAAFELWR